MNKLIITIALILTAGMATAGGPPQLYSADGTYLGNLSSNPYDANSINNPYGRYGNPYSPDSINNPYSTYGNPYSPNSPNNPYATGAPRAWGY